MAIEEVPLNLHRAVFHNQLHPLKSHRDEEAMQRGSTYLLTTTQCMAQQSRLDEANLGQNHPLTAGKNGHSHHWRI